VTIISEQCPSKNYSGRPTLALFMRPNISRLNYFIYKLRLQMRTSVYSKTTLTTIFFRFNRVVIIIHITIIIRWPRRKPNDASAEITDYRRHPPRKDNIVIVPSISSTYARLWSIVYTAHLLFQIPLLLLVLLLLFCYTY